MPHSTSILLLGDGTEAIRLRQRLARHFLAVEHARNFGEARAMTQRCRFHVLVLIDPAGPWKVVQQSLEAGGSLPSNTLLVTDRSRAVTAVNALRGGVSDVLLRPFATADLVAAVLAVNRYDASQQQATSAGSEHVLVGESPSIRAIRSLIERVAPVAAAVLVEGEAGTGRKWLARLLHERSGREGSFIAVDCRGIDETRLARELGRHRQATAESTLFLGAVDAMPLDLQDEMLRSMETVAGHGASRAGAIVASTQADLGDRVMRHRFRDDLWQRLRVLRIGLPPLRERREDIPLLAAHFVDTLAAEAGLSRVEFQPAEIEALVRHDWPGNVAELLGVVEQTLLRGQLPADALLGTVEQGAGTPDYPLDWTLEQVKRHHMMNVLEACGGNKSAAARRLDISRKTLDRKLAPSDTSKGD